MELEICSFELAKMLKDVGFDEITKGAYFMHNNKIII